MEFNQTSNIDQFFGFEEQQIIRNSLTILQKENHLEKMFIWGRIFTHEDDYVIAFGYKYDIIKNLRFFYAKMNTLDWALLTHVNSEKKLFAIECNNDFTGILSQKIRRSACLLEDDFIYDFKLYRLNEEDRLASTVKMITEECFLLPRGSVLRHYDNTITKNSGFVGLLQNEINCLSSYHHYRIPIANCHDDYLPKNNNNIPSINCFDFIDSDPVESWSLQMCDKLEQIHIQSMNWPGYNFFYDNKTKQYGSIYVGFGLKNQFNFD